jgi:hypothetical protein
MSLTSTDFTAQGKPGQPPSGAVLTNIDFTAFDVGWAALAFEAMGRPAWIPRPGPMPFSLGRRSWRLREMTPAKLSEQR